MTAPLDIAQFQEEGAAFLAARTRAFLLDEMGVGKSAATVRACDRVGAERILVLVPASGRVNWLDEFHKFSPLDRDGIAVMTGRDKPLAVGVTVCSYDLLRNPTVRKSLLAQEWDVLILDEAHYLKERKALRTRAVYGARCDNAGQCLAARARRVWGLSGTLAPNNVSELWTHLHAAGAFEGNWYRFVEQFCTGYNSEYGFRITGTRNADKLRALLAPLVLRRVKEDVLPLPPITFETHTLEPGPVDVELHFLQWLMGRTIEQFNEHLEQVNSDLRNAFKEAGDDPMRGVAAVASGTAQLRRYVGLSIVEAYARQVTAELRSGELDKVVVFAHHADIVEMLRERLSAFDPVVIYGKTPAEKRAARIKRFQENPNCRVFIGNIVAAGTAITLTAACNVDFVEQSWVPGENAQAAMRVHRVGQTRPCRVRYFGCGKGVHKDILDANARKTTELIKVSLA